MDNVTRYWLTHYATEHCTLCGNHGVIDTRGLRTPAGVEVGRLNYCICPNGQAMRDEGIDMRQYVTLHMNRVPVSLGVSTEGASWAMEGTQI